MKLLHSLAIVYALFVQVNSFCTPFAVNSRSQLSSFQGTCLTTREVTVNETSLQMMRHRKRVAKLGKPADQRKALLRALTTELIRHGRIKTTLVRARAMRKFVDHMITLGKNGSLHARRQAMGFIYDKSLVHAMFEQVPERYGERNGGYCRVLKTMPRRGDNAKMAIIELV